MISVIIAAAGSGRRMGCKKQFMNVLGEPLISYTLRTFQHSAVDEIIIVTSESDIPEMEKICEKYSISKVKAVVAGGDTRQRSVMLGLSHISGDIVLIHDGARPFVKGEEIRNVAENADKFGGSILATPCIDTVKVTDGQGFVKSTPDRNHLYCAATPQGFRSDLIKSAYQSAELEGFTATDDSMVAEHYGINVKITPCSRENIKITTPEDIAQAEAIIEKRKKDENRQRI